MSEQLEQLRRERELDEERYRELRKAIEIAHVPIEKPNLDEEMLVSSRDNCMQIFEIDASRKVAKCDSQDLKA